MATYTDRFLVYDANGRIVQANENDSLVITGSLTVTTLNLDSSGSILPSSDGALSIGSEDYRFQTFWGNLDGAVRFKAKNDHGAQITKGQVVYIKGISGSVPTVGLARANSSSTMPAFGIAFETANDQAEVEIVTFGTLYDVNTSGLTANSTLYVSSATAGAVTSTKPTGSNTLLQNIGRAVRIDGTAGIIIVGGAGRTNATPNVAENHVFIGDANGQSTTTELNLDNVTSIGDTTTNSLTLGGLTLTNHIDNRLLYTDANGAINGATFLKYDAVNSRLGIGTATPLTTVEIVGDTAGEAQLSIRQHNNDADGPDVTFYKSRGTESSKTNVLANDVLTRVNTQSYNGTSYVDSGHYGWSASDTSGNSTFSLATRVSNSSAVRFGINSTGNVTFNEAYSFPSSDGSADQVLTTNGAGQLSFADASGGGGVPSITVSSISANQTLTAPSTSEEVYIYTPSSVYSVFLVSASTCGAGFRYHIKNRGSFSLIIDPNGTETIDGEYSYTLTVTESSVSIITDGSNWFII